MSYKIEEVNNKLAEAEDLTDDLLQEVQRLKQIASGVRKDGYFSQKHRTRKTFRKLLKTLDKVK